MHLSVFASGEDIMALKKIRRETTIKPLEVISFSIILLCAKYILAEALLESLLNVCSQHWALSLNI